MTDFKTMATDANLVTNSANAKACVFRVSYRTSPSSELGSTAIKDIRYDSAEYENTACAQQQVTYHQNLNIFEWESDGVQVEMTGDTNGYYRSMRELKSQNRRYLWKLRIILDFLHSLNSPHAMRLIFAREDSQQYREDGIGSFVRAWGGEATQWPPGHMRGVGTAQALQQAAACKESQFTRRRRRPRAHSGELSVIIQAAALYAEAGDRQYENTLKSEECPTTLTDWFIWLAKYAAAWFRVNLIVVFLLIKAPPPLLASYEHVRTDEERPTGMN
ncbi:MAG: hypothetical protein Q9160_001908 [Pyrenula sp. 1 TL-2023]